MTNSAESRVVLAAHNEQFGTDGGFFVDRPITPVSCYAAAATIAAGVAAAFVTGAALAGAAHYFGGGHRHFDHPAGAGGPAIEPDSLDALLGVRLDALPA